MVKDFQKESDKELSRKEQMEQNKFGHLKIFLGYAPGVGKTYSMLSEANRRRERGEDIVVGYLESHGRRETELQVKDIPIINRKKIEHNGVVSEEVDTEAVINRRPSVVLIDELAHTNAVGSINSKRYEDVLDILEVGIDVMTTLNIQHLESLNDTVRQITGLKVKETIPDTIVDNADEVVIVDITPETLQSRLRRGNIYNLENVDKVLKNFFRKGNLNALRELALRHVAEEVDDELKEYMEEHGINENWHTTERVMVCISPSPYAKKLIRRGARIARRYRCEWYVVDVNCTNMFAPKITEKDRKMIKNHYKLAKELGAHVVSLTGKSISKELSAFANEKHITQIIIGHSRRTKFQTLLRGSTVTKLLKQTKDVEVHVIPNDF